MSGEAIGGECRNCHAVLQGPYCSACGQRATAPNPTFHDLVHEYTHELLHVDGRLWRSVWLLLSRPGRLTREYCAGRRASYLAPLRLYLIFSILAFAIPSLTPTPSPSQVTVSADTSSQAIPAGGSGVVGEVARKLSSPQLRDRIRSAVHAWLPRMMLVMLPVWALLVMLLTWSARRNFPEYMIFSLHCNAAFFAAFTVNDLLDLTQWDALDSMGNLITLVYVGWYMITALRAVFGGSWRRSVFRAVVISTLYGIILLVGLLSLLLLAALDPLGLA